MYRIVSKFIIKSIISLTISFLLSTFFLLLNFIYIKIIFYNQTYERQFIFSLGLNHLYKEGNTSLDYYLQIILSDNIVLILICSIGIVFIFYQIVLKKVFKWKISIFMKSIKYYTISFIIIVFICAIIHFIKIQQFVSKPIISEEIFNSNSLHYNLQYILYNSFPFLLILSLLTAFIELFFHTTKRKSS